MDTPNTTVAAASNQKPNFFVNRNFAFLWGGQAISIKAPTSIPIGIDQ